MIVAFPEFITSASTGARQIAPDPRGISRLETKISCLPSGDQVGSTLTWLPVVSAVDRPVSRSRILRLMLWPSSSAVYTSHLPSGDHSGEERYSLAQTISYAIDSPGRTFQI